MPQQELLQTKKQYAKMSKLIYTIVILAVITFIIIFHISESSDPDVSDALEEIDSNNSRFTSSAHKLLNITFKYILNNEHACTSTEDILAVFIVTSYFGNAESRSSIRRVFNAEDLGKYRLKLVFLLGEASGDKYTSQTSVNDESHNFKDIIQGNFSEAYRNLTYKHIMGLKWASTYCSEARYVIKMDDDTVVNMYMIETILDYLRPVQKWNFIAGYKLVKMKPIREPANKWFVTEEEYSPPTYPTFVSGWFYITNPETATKLTTLANYEKYFWIDDVFVTGILANKLKIRLIDISQHFVVNSEFLQCCLQDFEKDLDCGISVGPNGGDTNMFFKFNTQVRKCDLSKQCSKRTRPLNETCVAERKVNLGKGDPLIRKFKLA